MSNVTIPAPLSTTTSTTLNPNAPKPTGNCTSQNVVAAVGGAISFAGSCAAFYCLAPVVTSAAAACIAFAVCGFGIAATFAALGGGDNTQQGTDQRNPLITTAATSTYLAL